MTFKKTITIPTKRLTFEQELVNLITRNLELHLEIEKLKKQNKRLISKLKKQENSQ